MGILRDAGIREWFAIDDKGRVYKYYCNEFMMRDWRILISDLCPEIKHGTNIIERAFSTEQHAINYFRSLKQCI